MQNTNTFNNYSNFNSKSNFIPVPEPIKKTIDFFGKKISSIVGGFKEAFQDKPKSITFKSFFSGNIQTNNQDNSFSGLKIKNIKDEIKINGLNTANFKKSTFRLTTSDFNIPNKSNFYDYNGKYIDTFKKGVNILSSVGKEIYFLGDEAFLYIDGHNNTKDGNKTLEPGYLRASWLDTYIITEKERERKLKEKQNNSYNSYKFQNTNNIKINNYRKQNNQEKINQDIYSNSQGGLFSGYKGLDGNELPEYIIKAVAINYFGKEFKVKLEEDINKTDSQISTIRDIIINNRLKNKTYPPNIDYISIQKEKIGKKHKLKVLSQAIDDAYSSKNNEINPEIEKLIISIKKTKEWDKILDRSTKISKRLKKTNKFKNAK
ncbi:hypothetical protein H3C61_03375 [Candidatus Gracilibacteria bacterium]|nr:hypothetical protein [Candidatus Gracilibacteria bacterium]